MKKSNDIVKTAPRIIEKTADFYRTKFNTLNAGLEYVLEAFPCLYARTISDLRGKFTRGELMLFIDAMNGHWYNPHGAGFEMGANVADGMALDHLDEKWGIPEKWALNKKLADITQFDRACLEIWIQAFWNQESYENIEEYVAQLT
jgi:hypothetical protein